MLEPPECSQEIVDWLSTLRLSQYISCFQEGGYCTLEDCEDLTDESLLELKVLPTGHRRRILRSLEAFGVKQQSGEEDNNEEGEESRKGRRMPVPHQRRIFLKDKKRGTSCQHHQSKQSREYYLEGSQTLPPGAGLASEAENFTQTRDIVLPQPAPRNPRNIQKSGAAHIPASMRSISSSSESLSTSEIPSDWEISSEGPSVSSTDSVPCPAEVPLPTEDQAGFHCAMVENSIYDVQPYSLKGPAGPRPTRSYKLRHRPVPEIPNLATVPLPDRYCSVKSIYVFSMASLRHFFSFLSRAKLTRR